MSKEKNPFHYMKRNPNFPSTESAVKKITPNGHNILVEEMEFSEVPRSKLELPSGYKSDFFNFVRAKLIAKGPECEKEYLGVGDTVFFARNLATTINYENPDKSDKIYSILSEQNLAYFIKK